MSIRSALRQHLLAQTTVTDLVGQRIYPIIAPQTGELPCIAYRKIEGGHEHLVTGSAGHARPTFTLTVWALDPDTVDDIAEALRLVLQGANATWGAYQVTGLTLDGDSDEWVDPNDGEDNGVYGCTLRISFRHAEPAPA